MIGKERIVPQIPIDPLLQREIARCEGSSVLESIVLPEKEQKFVVYLCAPLQPTARKSGFQHIVEVIRKASLIEGATYQGEKVACFIPHIETLIPFNEFDKPTLREPAIAVNLVGLGRCNLMAKIGTRNSPGMRGEIDAAKGMKIPIMSFATFKKHLTNLPSIGQSQEAFARLMKSLPPELFVERLFQKKARRK